MNGNERGSATGVLTRFVESIREVTGVDGRMLSSQVFTRGPDGRAVPHAPVNCIAELTELTELGYVLAMNGICR